MSNAKKRRRARRRLKAHTKWGENRHVKSTAHAAKLARLHSEKNREKV